MRTIPAARGRGEARGRAARSGARCRGEPAPPSSGSPAQAIGSGSGCCWSAVRCAICCWAAPMRRRGPDRRAARSRGGAPALRLAEAAAGRASAVVAHARFGTVTLAGPARRDRPRRGARRALRGARRAARGAPRQRSRRICARRDFSVNAMAMPLNAAARRGRPALSIRSAAAPTWRGGRLRVLHPRELLRRPDAGVARGAARGAARLPARRGEPARAARRALAAARFDARLGRALPRRAREALRRSAARRAIRPARWRCSTPGACSAALARGLALAPRRRARRCAWLGARLALAPAADALARTGLCAWLAPLAAGRPAPRARAPRARAAGRPSARAGASRRCCAGAARGLARAQSRGASDAVLRDRAARGAARARRRRRRRRERRRILRHAREDRARAPAARRPTTCWRSGSPGPRSGAALAALRRACARRRGRRPGEALAGWRRLHRFRGAQRAHDRYGSAHPRSPSPPPRRARA